MDSQQIFCQRLTQLLDEKQISQKDLAQIIGCSRQSINLYLLGKRTPDITIAGQMATCLGVSCDYLLGLSEFRLDCLSVLPAKNAGISEAALDFFMRLKVMSDGAILPPVLKYAQEHQINYEEDVLPYATQSATDMLEIANDLLSQERFVLLLQYIKRYRDLCHGQDELTILKNFMFELDSVTTGKSYGTEEENEEMMKEFCLHLISKYFDEIVKEITE